MLCVSCEKSEENCMGVCVGVWLCGWVGVGVLEIKRERVRAQVWLCVNQRERVRKTE